MEGKEEKEKPERQPKRRRPMSSERAKQILDAAQQERKEVSIDNPSVSGPRSGRTRTSGGGPFNSLQTSLGLGLRDKPNPMDPETMPGEVTSIKPAEGIYPTEPTGETSPPTDKPTK